jgi:hypothetical protein
MRRRGTCECETGLDGRVSLSLLSPLSRPLSLRTPDFVRQYFYFPTSKASKRSTCCSAHQPPFVAHASCPSVPHVALHAYIHTYIHVMHACMHAYIHTHDTYIHSYIHTYMYIHVDRRPRARVFREQSWRAFLASEHRHRGASGS